MDPARHFLLEKKGKANIRLILANYVLYSTPSVCLHFEIRLNWRFEIVFFMGTKKCS